jgi:hypothetical protein
VAERGENPKLGGIADKYVEPGPAVEQRRGELVDLNEIAQVDGDESSIAAGRANRVVNLLEASDRARRQDDMCALAREALGDGRTDAARGASDQRDLTGEATDVVGTQCPTENSAIVCNGLPSPPQKRGSRSNRFSPWFSGFPLSRE